MQGLPKAVARIGTLECFKEVASPRMPLGWELTVVEL
jgi:hypothetical protein